MAAPRFFAGRPRCRWRASTAKSTLPDDVAHHALRVLRLAPGDAIVLFDGTGGEYAATITRAGKRDAWARIDRFDPVDRESPLAVTLVQAHRRQRRDGRDRAPRGRARRGRHPARVAERSARFPAGRARRQAPRALAAGRGRGVRAVRPQPRSAGERSRAAVSNGCRAPARGHRVRCRRRRRASRRCLRQRRSTCWSGPKAA